MLTLKKDMEKIQQKAELVPVTGDVLSEDREEKILDKAGFRNVLDYNRKRRNAVDMINKFGPAINYADLKKVGLKYGMVLCRPEHYTGLIGPETAKKMDIFEKTHKVELKGNLLVLCPKDLSSQFTGSRAVYISEEKERIRRLEEDPVLLYSDNAGMYHIIDQWGRDMTIFHAIKTAWNYIHIRVKWLAFGVLCYAANIYAVTQTPMKSGLFFLLMASAIISGVIGFFYCVFQACSYHEGKWLPGERKILTRHWS